MDGYCVYTNTDTGSSVAFHKLKSPHMKVENHLVENHEAAFTLNGEVFNFW